MEVDPGFIDATGHDFGLKPDSPLIDAGAFLTTAVGTGEGTCLPIKDTGWFYDGFGIPGERGDLIQLEGQTEPAHIVSIDNATSTLRLDRLLKWTDGQGIARRYFGSRPDVGAVESLPGGNEPPVAGVSATPATDNPLAVLLDGSSSSDADGRIASYDWDFGDGQRVENGPATLSHAFARSGRFTVTLKVTDNGRPSQSAYACLAVRVGTPKLVVEPTACNLDFQATTARIVIRNLGEGNTAMQAFALRTVDRNEPAGGHMRRTAGGGDDHRGTPKGSLRVITRLPCASRQGRPGARKSLSP